jgi:competence protein ComEC
VSVAAALATGVAAAEWLDLPAVGCWLGAVVAVCLWWAAYRPGAAGQHRARVAEGCLLLAIAAGGAGWCAVRSRLFAVDDLAWGLSSTPRPVAVEGVVVEPPRRLLAAAREPVRADSPRTDSVAGLHERLSSECLIAVCAVRDGSAWRPASGRAAVVVDGAPPSVAAGARVRVFGRGLRPPPPLNPGEFDFHERSRSLRCLSLIRVAGSRCVRVLSRPVAWSPGPLLERLRGAGAAVLTRHLEPERAALAAALLLGSREALPREDALEFLVTGTIHILSISGLHVGFLAITLFFLLRLLPLPRGWSLVAVAAVTGLYMLLVGAETPVVRATLVVWVTCLGAAIGRRSPGVNALALAAILVMLWHPPELFRTGSQLSFLSTAVLVGASGALPRRRATEDPIERLIDRARPPWLRRARRLAARAAATACEGAVVGAAVWAATAPIVAARFHLVSPVGLLLNPLVAPLVAVAMAWGFLCLAVSTVSATLAGVCGRACDATLAVIAGMVNACAAVPGGFVWVAGPPTWWVAGWYLAFAGLLLLLPGELRSRPRTWVAAAAVWLAVGAASVGAARLVFPRPAGLRVVVAAVGHGCGIMVRSPCGRCLLYDAGRLGAPTAARRAVESVLWEEGVRRIDTLVVSHADADHFNAVPDLFARFSVGELVVPPQLMAHGSWGVAELLRRARAAGVPVRSMRAGDSFALDPLCRVRSLHPPADAGTTGGPHAGVAADRRRSDNETSLVLAVESAGRRLLLTGDIEGDAVARFVATDPGACDVLVAPHHGSRTSLPPHVARATSPRWVVVSGPGSAGWPEVRRAYAAAMPEGSERRVVKTGADAESAGGAIAIDIDAAGVRVAQFAAGAWRTLPDDAHGAGHCAVSGAVSVAARQVVPAEGAAASSAPPSSGRVSAHPARMIASWLTTNPASSMSTPLVKP